APGPRPTGRALVDPAIWSPPRPAAVAIQQRQAVPGPLTLRASPSAPTLGFGSGGSSCSRSQTPAQASATLSPTRPHGCGVIVMISPSSARAVSVGGIGNGVRGPPPSVSIVRQPSSGVGEFSSLSSSPSRQRSAPVLLRAPQESWQPSHSTWAAARSVPSSEGPWVHSPKEARGAATAAESIVQVSCAPATSSRGPRRPNAGLSQHAARVVESLCRRAQREFLGSCIRGWVAVLGRNQELLEDAELLPESSRQSVAASARASRETQERLAQAEAECRALRRQ
ncbi:unnamed protein product, partial [Polarella glacialis]